MTAAPSDGLGDGTEVTPISINVDVTTLSQQAASEYRHELIHALHNPGTEFDAVTAQGASDHAAYYAQLKAVDAYLATFTEKI